LVRNAGEGGRQEALTGWCVVAGCVVIDKSFVFMALACAAAPFLGAGFYLVVHLF
jgi:hypothetical protein